MRTHCDERIGGQLLRSVLAVFGCAALAAGSIAASAGAAGLDEWQEIEPAGTWCDELEYGGFGQVLALGDLDGDGRDDLIAGRDNRVHVYYSEGTYFSWSPSEIPIDARSVVATDVNGDDVDDLIVVGRRTAWAFHGGAERFPTWVEPLDHADWTYYGANDFFTGSSVATGWKLAARRGQSDGVHGIVLGSPQVDHKAFKFQGSLGAGLSAGPVGAVFEEGWFILEGAAAMRVLGRAVLYDVAGSLGIAVGRGPSDSSGSDFQLVGVPGASVDLDNDGVFEPGEANAGAVYNGLFQLLAGDIVPGAYFGYELGDAGDVNNDGHRDVIISAKRKGSAAPKAFVYLGSGEYPGFTDPDYAWAVEEPEQRIFMGAPNPAFDTLGQSVGSAGDINGDGYGDLFVGDPRYDATGQNKDQEELGWWGRGLVWFGGPSGSGDPSGLGANPTPQTADIALYGSWKSGEFGKTFASGDINGDGLSDLVVGDPRGAAYCIEEARQCVGGSTHGAPCSSVGAACPGGGTCEWVEYQRFAETGLVWPYVSDFNPGPPCSDGLDNDGDGLTDFAGGDPGCADEADLSERDPSLPCDDGVDNDGDGRSDFDPATFANPGNKTTPPAGTGDPGCHDPSWGKEDPECQDGIDNDADGKMDYDAGFSANGSATPAARDPECAGKPWKNSECGLGAELAVLVPTLAWLYGRRRNRS
jgi:hypothetical protein